MTQDELVETLRRRFRRFLLISVALLAVFVVSVWLVGAKAQHDTEATARALVKAGRLAQKRVLRRQCARGNLVRANTQINVRAGLRVGVGSHANVARNRRLLPIIDCDLSVRAGGATIPLSAVEQARYLRVVAQSRVPIVRQGQVVGSLTPRAAMHRGY